MSCRPNHFGTRVVDCLNFLSVCVCPVHSRARERGRQSSCPVVVNVQWDCEVSINLSPGGKTKSPLFLQTTKPKAGTVNITLTTQALMCLCCIFISENTIKLPSTFINCLEPCFRDIRSGGFWTSYFKEVRAPAGLMASMCEDDDSHVQVEPNVVKINSVSLLVSVFLLSLLPNHDQQNNRLLSCVENSSILRQVLPGLGEV